MIDLHDRPASAAAALSAIRAITPSRPMSVEEPVPPGETEALKVVAASAKFPLATGERLIDRPGFDDLLPARAGGIEVVRGPIRMAEGCWKVPEALGFGIEIDEPACARHRFAPEVLQTRAALLDDGTMLDW